MPNVTVALGATFKRGCGAMAKPKDQKKADDERSPAETERIREATLKRLLKTPPKRHADILAERKEKRSKK